MTRYEALRREATQCATWRGHRMGQFARITPTVGESVCAVCGARVSIDTHPPANGIAADGDAVALTCPVSEGLDHVR